VSEALSMLSRAAIYFYKIHALALCVYRNPVCLYSWRARLRKKSARGLYYNLNLARVDFLCVYIKKTPTICTLQLEQKIFAEFTASLAGSSSVRAIVLLFLCEGVNADSNECKNKFSL
jgi:hypothetical protein